MELIDKAQQAGLSQPLVMALRKQLGAAHSTEPPAAENRDPTKTITSVTVTQTTPQSTTTTSAPLTTRPPEPTKTRTDTDPTLTAPVTGQNSTTGTRTDGERTVMLNTTG